MENIFESIQNKNAQRGNLILKAFGEGETLEKGKKATIGEIRDWGSKKYKKQSNGKWMEVSESHGMTKKEHEAKGLNSGDESYAHTIRSTKLSDKEYDESELSGGKTIKNIDDLGSPKLSHYLIDGKKAILNHTDKEGIMSWVVDGKVLKYSTEKMKQIIKQNKVQKILK